MFAAGRQTKQQSLTNDLSEHSKFQKILRARGACHEVLHYWAYDFKPGARYQKVSENHAVTMNNLQDYLE